MKFAFSIIQIAYAHEEGATKITAENSLGPVLAFAIIIAAIIIVKRVNKQNRFKTKQDDERKQTN